MSALGILYDRYSGLVYTIALKVLGDPQAAEDLTQEIFLRLWRQSGYRPSRGSLVRFLATLTRKRAGKLRSRRGRRQFLHGWGRPTNIAFSPSPQVESLSASDESSQQIRRAWFQLPENQRQILAMAYYGGLSQLEIAKQLDIPLNTVKYQARQGILRLRTSLQNLINDRGDTDRQMPLAQAQVDKSKNPTSLAAVLPSQKPFEAVFGIIASIISLLALMLGGFYIFRVNLFTTGVQPSVSAISDRDTVNNRNKMEPAQTLTAHASVVWALALSADGQTLVSGGADKTIKVWNIDTNQVSHTLSGHTDTIRAIALSANGQTLASGSGDNAIKLWNIKTGRLIRTLTGHMGPVWSVAISLDGQTLVSGGEDGALKIWDLQTGDLLRTIPAHLGRVFCVAIAPDGETIATGGIDTTLKLWSLKTGELISTIAAHSSAVRAIAFSPDGQHLASGSWDKTIKLWDWRNRALIHTLADHTLRVVTVAFSPNGQTLASGSLDQTLKLWDVKTGELHQTLVGHSDWVLAIATDTERLVSSSKDDTIQIWRRSNQ